MASRVLQLLREAAWLDAGRVRGYAVLLGIASAVLLAVAYQDAMGPEGSDFLAFWGAGKVAAEGSPALAYDLATQRAVQTATGSDGWFAFVNPPPFLLLVAPLGALPYPLAWLAWVALTYAAWAWAAIRALPRLWPLVLVFPGALLAAGHAQTGLLTGALLIGGVTLVDRRPLVAGALFGVLIVKPHLALLVPLWLITGGRWKALAATAVSAGAFLLIALLAFGPETLRAYPSSWEASAALLDAAGPDFYLRMSSFYAQAALVMPPPWALALHCLPAIVATGLVLGSWPRFADDTLASGAVMLAATALASPYLFNYDLPFLALPVFWLVGQGLERGFRAFEKLLLVALFLAPFATRAAALPLGVNLMPLASLSVLALVWTRGFPTLTTLWTWRHRKEQTRNRCGTASQAVH